MDDLSDVSEIRGGWWTVLAVWIAATGNLLVGLFGGGWGDFLGWGLGVMLAVATLAVVYRPLSPGVDGQRCARCGTT